MTEPKYRILVADDDEMIRELHAEFVRGFGYEVEVAADGIEAIAKIGLGVDLVLTDAHMPNMDGFDVARRIRETKSSEELPIVMATSLEAREDRLRAYEVGINDFINKPVDHTELRLRLKWLLELKTAQDKLRASKQHLEDTVDLRTRELRHALEEVTRAQRRVHEGHLDTIRRLTVAAEYKDHDTAGHIERIGRYSEIVGHAMHLAPGTVDLLLHAAPMHDVGKLGIPDHILLKPGPLTDEERQIMNTHTTIGAQILSGSQSPVIQMGERVALSHHEKWNGQGYPRGMSGEDIPIEARVCTVVDFFDALTFDRPYRKAVPNDEVIEMIVAESGTSFDPAIVEVFLEVRSEIERIQAEYLD
ncbi:MAG: response regulator [Gemmatimonadota bacterium]|jgi:putative two-component system response regulator